MPGIPSFLVTRALKPLMDRDDVAYRGFLGVSAYLSQQKC